MTNHAQEETEKIEIQERAGQAVEDRSLPAAQVLTPQDDPAQRPGLFIP